MDLSSRWDGYAAAFFVIFAIALMAGCQAVPGATPSTTHNGSVATANASLDFGTALVGVSKQLTDALTNSTSTTVTIASAVSSDPSFQVTAPAMPLICFQARARRSGSSSLHEPRGNLPAG